jgi:hypothetical protein
MPLALHVCSNEYKFALALAPATVSANNRKRSYNRALAFCPQTCWPPRRGDDQLSAPPIDHGSNAS